MGSQLQHLLTEQNEGFHPLLSVGGSFCQPPHPASGPPTSPCCSPWSRWSSSCPPRSPPGSPCRPPPCATRSAPSYCSCCSPSCSSLWPYSCIPCCPCGTPCPRSCISC